MSNSVILFLAFIGPFFGGLIGVSFFTVHLMITAKKAPDKKLDLYDIRFRGLVTVFLYTLVIIISAVLMNKF
jgi:hypothetical protein